MDKVRLLSISTRTAKKRINTKDRKKQRHREPLFLLKRSYRIADSSAVSSFIEPRSPGSFSLPSMRPQDDSLAVSFERGSNPFCIFPWLKGKAGGSLSQGRAV